MTNPRARYSWCKLDTLPLILSRLIRFFSSIKRSRSFFDASNCIFSACFCRFPLPGKGSWCAAQPLTSGPPIHAQVSPALGKKPFTTLQSTFGAPIAFRLLSLNFSWKMSTKRYFMDYFFFLCVELIRIFFSTQFSGFNSLCFAFNCRFHWADNFSIGSLSTLSGCEADNRTFTI